MSVSKTIVHAALGIIAFTLMGAGCQTQKAAQKGASPNPPAAARADNGDSAATAKAVADTLESIISMDTLRIDAEPAWAPKKAPYNPSRTVYNDLLHVKLEVRFDWAKREMPGKATLTLKPHFYPTDSLTLDAKYMRINRVAVSKAGKLADLAYTYADNQKLHIALDKRYTRDEKYDVFIDYVAQPELVPNHGSEAINGNKGLYFINHDGSEPGKPRQIWTQGETESTSCWAPVIDSPNERTTQEMYITVADSFTTLGNGVLASKQKNADGTRTDYWQMKQPHAPYLFMMAVGNFKVTNDTWRGIPVQYYLEPKYAPYAKTIFGETPQMLEFYSKRLGVPYPWPKYAQVVVRDFVSGAMENTTATIHYAPVQHDTRDHLDDTQEEIIAHELFHHWFGDYVTCESWSNLPLNESFATYGEYLWLEHRYGRQQADHHLGQDLENYLYEAEEKREPLIRYYYKDKEDMFDAHSYQKGGRVLHMLRNLVGDDAFFASLKLYLERNAYRSVEINNLRLAFEEVTGQDLQWFFDQWFLRPGHAELNITYMPEGARLKVRVQQTQNLKYQPMYTLPTRIEVMAGGTRTLHAVTISTADTTFTVPVNGALQNADLDPDKALLARVRETKPLAWWVAQLDKNGSYGQKRNAIDTLKALAAQNDTTEQALIAACQDPFWGTRKDALQALQATQKNAKMVPLLSTLATTDPKAAVRKEATEYLAAIVQEAQKENSMAKGDVPPSLNGPALAAVFEKTVADSSYATVAAGIKGLYAVSKSKGLQSTKANLNSNSAWVRCAVAEVLLEERTPESTGYATQVIKDLPNSIQKYFLIQKYGQVLLFMDAAAQEKGLELLKDIALNNGVWQIRLEAVKGLAPFAARPDVRAFFQDLKQKEKHPQLKELYQKQL
jgi:aminopeptidase N